MVLEDFDKDKEIRFYPPGTPLNGIETRYGQDLYETFFRKLPFFYKIEEMIMVHAGLNTKIEAPLLDFESMMWIRDFYPPQDLPYRVIHGHDPLPLQIYKTFHQQRSKIDQPRQRLLQKKQMVYG